MIKYKESGVEWISEIPLDWSVCKFKNIINSSIAGEVIDKNYWNTGTELLYTCQRTPMLSNFSNFPERKRTREGDLLLTRNATPYIFIPKPNSIYSNVVQRVTLKSGYNIDFVKYSLELASKFIVVNGDTIPSYNMNVWGNLYIPNISISEQERIVNYLKNKVEQIDNLISLQKEELEKLDEYKKSFICEQINCCKESIARKTDTESWFYNIPSDWNVAKIKNIAKTSSGGTPTSSEPLYYDGDINWICSYDLHEKEITESGRKITKLGMDNCAGSLQEKDCILVAMYGGAGTIGNSGLLKVEAVTNQAICSINFDKIKIDPLFAFYQIRFLRPYFMKYAVGTRKDPNISQETIANMQFVYPDIKKQKEIAEKISSKLEQIEKLKDLKSKKIDCLENYKLSLMYEILTGKKEI